MDRFPSAVLIGSTVLGSWLGMQAVHELGRVLGAWLTGGRVAQVVLNPLTISRTDLVENPRPLIVVWAGPSFGATAPLVLWGAARALGFSCAFVLRFFAGFCLLANGLYIGIGSFGRIGDCDEMLRSGSAPSQLWLFGLVAAPLGLLLWNGQSSNFGLGKDASQVRPFVAYGSLIVCLALFVLGFAVGGE